MEWNKNLWRDKATSTDGKRNLYADTNGQTKKNILTYRPSADVLVDKLLQHTINHIAISLITILPFALLQVSNYIGIQRMSYNWSPLSQNRLSSVELRLWKHGIITTIHLLALVLYIPCPRTTSYDPRVGTQSLCLQTPSRNASCDRSRSARCRLAMISILFEMLKPPRRPLRTRFWPPESTMTQSRTFRV